MATCVAVGMGTWAHIVRSSRPAAVNPVKTVRNACWRGMLGMISAASVLQDFQVSSDFFYLGVTTRLGQIMDIQ